MLCMIYKVPPFFSTSSLYKYRCILIIVPFVTSLNHMPVSRKASITFPGTNSAHHTHMPLHTAMPLYTRAPNISYQCSSIRQTWNTHAIVKSYTLVTPLTIEQCQCATVPPSTTCHHCRRRIVVPLHTCHTNPLYRSTPKHLEKADTILQYYLLLNITIYHLISL